MSIESTRTNAVVGAYQLLRYWRLIDIDERIKKINEVSRQSIEKVARKLLSSNPTMASIGPVKNLESIEKVRSRLN